MTDNPPYRKRKLYKFGVFKSLTNCFEVDTWNRSWQPDVLELGAGRADLSVELARRYPSQRFLAIDVKADRLQAGGQSATEAKLTNVRFLRARIDQLIELLPAQKIKTIWLTFPDPFPRNKQAKKRLVAPRYLALYQQLLTAEGELCFKTDNLALFQFGLESLIATGWQIQQLSFDLHGSDLSEDLKITTAYERRYLAEGQSIYFVRAKSAKIGS